MPAQQNQSSRTLAAEIITTGTEILLGEIVDTNAAWIAQQLREAGVNLYFKTTVGDNEHRLRGVLELALSRSDVIIVTGGLGPTVDDITRQAVAGATHRTLVLHRPTLEKLQERFARWGNPMTENNRQQAFIPDGALLIQNPVGTAPGFIVETDTGTIIALPGVPREMKHLMLESVLPYLRRRSGGIGVIRRRVLRTVGIGESNLDSYIHDLMYSANPTVGLAAHTGQTDIRIAARADTADEAEALLDQMQHRLQEAIGQYIYSTRPEETVEAVVASMLQSAGKTVAIVETNTGGAVARRLAQALPEANPIAVAWVAEGGQALSNWPEQAPDLQDAQFSAALAEQVAQAVVGQGGAALGLAILGTGRPDEGIYGDQTGETWMAVADASDTHTSHFPYGGLDELTAIWIGNRSLDLLRRRLGAASP